GEESAAARQRSSETLKIGEYRKPLSRIRKIIAANLARTRDELVLLTTFNEADMSAIKTMRARFGEAFKDRYGVKLGFMSFFLKASASALAAYPEVNAYIDGDEVVYRDGIHISVAVSTPKGLVTPVVRHVESRGFAEIEKEIIGFSQKAADKTLMPDDLMGGSFTITNGGIFGSMLSTPLPAPKQSAILGMHAIKERPVALNGEVVIRPMMYLALSYDHRLVDGREAVGCLKSIKEALENPERLLLEV
ncbi:MAG: 2-oxo acid dehydrogenase subunit E2, partial [Spirochaetaceae bacterium]|nr:2-oxo acid dehydrogenase subunit E2 [Spirochaetaceae bacterium]